MPIVAVQADTPKPTVLDVSYGAVHLGFFGQAKGPGFAYPVIEGAFCCFSPVLTWDSLGVDRARKFPALINCSNIDWFHEWPHEALVSVSQRFLSEVKDLPVSWRLNRLWQSFAT